MNDTLRNEPLSARAEEDRLALALVGRGLLTRDEVQSCRSSPAVGAEGLLNRLVEKHLVTEGQAQRVRQELSQLLGEQIPGYQLLEKIGQGSWGIVYKARQVSMNRLVAVKLLLPRRLAKEKWLEQFRREAHLAAKLCHNNIVQAIDVGSAGPLHYFIMEYVEGTTVKDSLGDGKVFPEREAVEIVVQIAQALQHAHRRGLIHRDIKPANILLTPDGVAKLADLGLAREASDTETGRRERGLAIGTPYYISPEQIVGHEDLDGRADLYALGATFYHMVTGAPPFDYKDIDTLHCAHLRKELKPPDKVRRELTSGLGEVVELMMAKERDDRYRCADELIFDLECLLNSEPPKIARQRSLSVKLKGLAEGDEVDEEAERRARGPSPTLQAWLIGLAIGLGLSLFLNLILL